MTARAFVRALKIGLPYMRGEDVLALQRALVRQHAPIGGADGIFGPQTETALKAWQTSQGLPATGVCDAAMWHRLFPDAAEAGSGRVAGMLARLRDDHARFPGGHVWRVSPAGIHINGAPPQGTGGEPVTIRRLWTQFGTAITRWSTDLQVPAELIVATIATETSGKPEAIRFEPNYTSDDATPDQISTGLMQTLISTARATLGNPAVNRAWLLVPENAIQAGTHYILEQSAQTGFDPPAVACAYNAGGIHLNDSAANPWRMRQYPIGTSAHCDRFVQWFNDCIVVFAALAEKPPVSFSILLAG